MNEDILQINVQEKVIEILLNKFDIKKEEIAPHYSLFDDLGINSIGLVEFAFEIKNKFDINLKFENLENIRTVQDVVQFIISNSDLKNK